MGLKAFICGQVEAPIERASDHMPQNPGDTALLLHCKAIKVHRGAYTLELLELLPNWCWPLELQPQPSASQTTQSPTTQRVLQHRVLQHRVLQHRESYNTESPTTQRPTTQSPTTQSPTAERVSYTVSLIATWSESYF